jgi:N-acetylglutamate synthase/N-acetylornithine aminotransferase
MEAPAVVTTVDLGLGTHGAPAWGGDPTEGYVRINADYPT